MFSKKFGLWILTALVGSSFSSGAIAQTLFQNNNQACEGEAVLCDSSPCIVNFPPARGISCRHVQLDGTYLPTDFNGDGFADCVAVRPNSSLQPSPSPQPHASVLMNRGAAAIACEPGPGDQFDPSLDYNLSGLDDSPQINTVLSGDLDGGNSDFVVPSVANAVEEMAAAMNPGSGFGPGGGSIVTVQTPWDVPANNQSGFFDTNGERSSALFDCNGDGDLDAVIALQDQSPSPVFSINILQNSGGVLLPPGAGNPVSTNVNWDQNNFAVLTVGNFDGDDDLDVAVAMTSTNDSFTPVVQAATVCINDGSCGFTCPATPTIDLGSQHPGQNAAAASVEAGDFNGDGFVDLAVSEPFLSASDPVASPEPQGVQYYFGDGAGAFPNDLFVPYDFFGGQLGTLTTGCYNNDNVLDVAVGLSFSEVPPLSHVAVLSSNGAGGINTPQALLVANLGTATLLDGVDSADFDNAGGDDIVALMNVANERQAVVFMNALETVSAIAGADQIASLNQATAVTGAACTLSPEIDGDPARFEVSWTLSPAAGATLSGADTLTPTFTATSNGVYTLTLQCRTRCTTIVTDTKQITVGAIPPTPVPTPTPLPFSQTQGGCLASLTPGSENSSHAWTAWAVLALASYLALRLGRGRRVY